MSRDARTEWSHPARQGYHLLQFTLALAAIIFGADKLFRVLVNWDKYLAPAIVQLLPVSGRTVVEVAGIAEIAAGILVAVLPRYGGYVLAAWLWAAVASMLLIPGYFDIALRDFFLSLAALALARLGQAHAQERRD